MYCPKCSQQQTSEQMRFCSRCGFPLSAVAELLEQGGVPPSTEIASDGRKLTKRQRSRRIGLLWMMTGGLLAMIAAIIAENIYVGSPSQDAVLFFLPAIICILIGFVRFFYAILLEEDEALPTAHAGKDRTHIKADAQIEGAAASKAALPPALENIPVSDFGTRRVETAEMIMQPPSVTENTTRMLEDEPKARRD